MNSFNDIFDQAKKKAEKLGEAYVKLLDLERAEITKQGAEQYWIELYDSGKTFQTNKNALALPYLLGITQVDPFEGEPELMIESKDGNLSDAIEVIDDDGNSVVISPFTEIKTQRGWVPAKDIRESDKLSGDDHE